MLAVVAFGGLPCSELLLQGGLFFLGIFSRFFLGIFSRFLVEGRCEEGRKEWVRDQKKTNRDQKKTNKDQKKQIRIKKNKFEN